MKSAHNHRSSPSHDKSGKDNKRRVAFWSFYRKPMVKLGRKLPCFFVFVLLLGYSKTVISRTWLPTKNPYLWCWWFWSMFCNMFETVEWNNLGAFHGRIPFPGWWKQCGAAGSAGAKPWKPVGQRKVPARCAGAKFCGWWMFWKDNFKRKELLYFITMQFFVFKCVILKEQNITVLLQYNILSAGFGWAGFCFQNTKRHCNWKPKCKTTSDSPGSHLLYG